MAREAPGSSSTARMVGLAMTSGSQTDRTLAREEFPGPSRVVTGGIGEVAGHGGPTVEVALPDRPGDCLDAPRAHLAGRHLLRLRLRRPPGLRPGHRRGAALRARSDPRRA